MRRFLLSTFTSSDNQSGDIHRIMLGAFGAAFIGFTWYSMWKGQPWDPITWVPAAVGLLVGNAYGLKIKDPTEPQKPPQ